MDIDKKLEKRGFYLISRDISPLIGLEYGKAGGDPGLTLKEAKDWATRNPDFVVINKYGDIVWDITKVN